jgi:hypothetical protein
MGKRSRFNPDEVAYAEAAGWRAYYDRQWLKLLGLMAAVNQRQFRIPFPVSVLAAYYVIRACVAWVPVNHDERKVRGFLERFYTLARHYAGLQFDPATCADFEVDYFAVHRRNVGNLDPAALVESLTKLHAALFNLSPEQVRESAEERAIAAVLVDGITNHASTDVEGDWSRLQEHLGRCYRSLQRELDRP